MNRLLQKVFDNRGYTYDFLNTISKCPHSEPKDTDVLCRVLKHYHDNQDLIVLLTDFDMDGIMCGTEGYAGLAELGFNVALFLPSVTQGYGFNAATIDRLVSEYPDVKAILTADVGITAYGGVDRAKALGLDIFVTDHHQVMAPTHADIIIDPTRYDDETGYTGYCGAHVLYHVLHYYAEHYTDYPAYYVSQIERLRVFAGIGTVSDSMPVYYENRLLIQDMVCICRMVYADGTPWFVESLPGHSVYRRAFLGLFTALSVFADNQKFTDSRGIDEGFVGYYLAPAFNSIKRMGGDIADAYGVFFGLDPKGSMTRIYELNEERKQAVDVFYERLFSVPQPWAPYIYVTDAIAGLRGLLAQKIMEHTNEPVLVVGSNATNVGYTGSGRSPVWFPFLDETVDLRCFCAGHNPAFGVGFDDDAAVDELFVFLQNRIPAVKPSDDELRYRPDFVIALDGSGDVGLDIPLFEDFLHSLSLCHPFGPGFPKPSILLKFPAEIGRWQVIGKDKTHLKVHLPHGFSVLCWHQASLVKSENIEYDGEWVGSVVSCADTDEELKDVYVVGELEFNEFNGAKSVQFNGQMVLNV